MKHFIVLLVLALTFYGIWHAIGPDARRGLVAQARPHIVPISIIVGVLLLGLVLMTLSRSINLL